MSNLSYLDKLLDGVELKELALGAVTQYEQPTKYLVKTKNYDDSFEIPVLTAGKTFILGYTDEINGINQASENPVIIFDDFTTANKWVDFDFKAKSSAMKMIKSSDESKFMLKYVYYWMNTLPSDLIEGDHKRQWISNYCAKKIPIPCPNNPEKSLAIQAEIVRILDAFTAMTAELTAELSLRKKQYNYYRDQLLSFEEGDFEWKTLGEIGHIVTGRTPKSSDKSAWGNDVDFVTPSDIKNGMRNITFPSRRLSAEGAASMSKVLIPSGSLLVTCIGADMGKTVINANDCIPNQQINAITLTDDSVQVGYLFHALTAMREAMRRQGELGGGTMPLINKSDFSKIVVPIPSHEEQNRIATILDKFDALTNSITEGLPREIELRQKQYEYYRDLLLSFPKSHSHEAA
ncbi:restriction endonuclease subunit S [Vibrio metschnikovii]|nr:restriction endonuclease subunit S [Vibrio metschnikovii]EKO3677834.1 restriction endonuclease subunit S [Vibrio metschnikovii]EKO3914328.1 restriction endonuclease subunit S [Vibrio metschnikovii]